MCIDIQIQKTKHDKLNKDKRRIMKKKYAENQVETV